jgi:hypothetical protein
MDYPFGFEGFESREGATDLHPTYLVLQSYCERSLHSFAEIDRHEFMTIENHVSQCDSCLLALINDRIQRVAESSSRTESSRKRDCNLPSDLT